MDTTSHTLETLFEQLGLDSGEQAMAQFFEGHRPLPAEVKLEEAEFWNQSQASFLRQARVADDAWAPAVDRLNVELR